MIFKVKSKEHKIDLLDVSKEIFEEIDRNTPKFDKKTGLGKMTVEGYEFLFLKDEESGCKTCFGRKVRDNCDWHFIRKVINKEGDGLVFKFNNGTSLSSESFTIKNNIKKFDRVVESVEKVIKQPGFENLYKKLAEACGKSYDMLGSLPKTRFSLKDVSSYDAAEFVDTKTPAYFVVAPHWNKGSRDLDGKDGKTLYMVRESDLRAKDLTIKGLINGSKDVNEFVDKLKDVGAVAVKNVVEDKTNGKTVVTYYDYDEVVKELKDDLMTTIMDKNFAAELNLKDFIDKKYDKRKCTYKSSLPVKYYEGAELNDATKDQVYFVVAPHWKEENRGLDGKDGKTLYMVKASDLQKEKLTIKDLDLLSSSPKAMNEFTDKLKNVGAVAVKEIVENKYNGNAVVTYYDEIDGVVKNNLTLKIKDTKSNDSSNLKTWIDNNYGNGKVSYSKSSSIFVKALKHKVALGLTTIAIAALAIAHFTVSSYVKNARSEEEARQTEVAKQEETKSNKEQAIASIKDETALAKMNGAEQMAQLVNDQDLFRVITNADGSKSIEMGQISEIVKNEILTYTQSSWPVYLDADGNAYQVSASDLTEAQLKKIDYTKATIEGAYEYLGRVAIDELTGEGYTVANRDLEGKYNPNFVYVVGTVDVAPNAYAYKTEMTQYISEYVADKEAAVNAYISGYTAEFEALRANGKITEENIYIQSTPVKEPIGYNDAQVRTILAKVTGDASTLFYVDENVAFAMSDAGSKIGLGNAIYKIEFQSGSDIETTDGLANALESATVTRARSANYLFDGKGYDTLIGDYESNFAKANNFKTSNMFIFNENPSNKGGKLTVDPDVIMVCNEGKTVIVIDNAVKVSVENDAQRNQYDQLAIALFGDQVINTNYDVENGTKTSKTYDSNDITIGDGTKTLSFTDKQKNA
ncbi:MAG: hypothetical protein ACI4R8_03075 [Candidatus Caccovivens sp.]